MSTFGGLMVEFPDVRVDNFRLIGNVRPPLACFLSHVHSDHLAGLENLKAPFVYCSAATRELLLRLERYPHRINFQLGILESRKQQYKHLKNLLKPIPLETPTSIELAPGNFIQVTLFDANHCTGAVMFLFEGDGKAVLYTGDIRSEPWFVNSLARNPTLIEYTTGLKTLDCIYLDTSFTENLPFPTKAEGLKELLEKVAKYPADTKFHLAAWTFGYEEVWVALSKALKSPIHVDKYKMRLYKSLCGDSSTKYESSGSFLAKEGPILTGYKCGNGQQLGCLTSDETVKLHSCEKGIKCSGIDDRTVWIRPIITRTSSGMEINEMGIGGGAGDLTQRPELELDNDAAVQQLIDLFASADSSILAEIKRRLLAGLRSTGKAVSLDHMGLDREEDELSLKSLAQTLTVFLGNKADLDCKNGMISKDGSQLPKLITFPYSRHSSYDELCHLVEAFKPNDIYPCTVDELNWHNGVSIGTLFGKFCSGSYFRHDKEMNMQLMLRNIEPADSQITYATSDDSEDDCMSDAEEHLDRQLQEELNLVNSPSNSNTLLDCFQENVTSTASTPAGKENSSDLSILRNNASAPPRPFDGSENHISILSDSNSPALSATVHNKFSRKDGTSNLHKEPSKRRRLSDEYLETEAERSDDDLMAEWNDAVSNQSVEGISYFDREDRVYRCQKCDWEVWNPSGQCAECGSGEPAYFEVILKKADPDGSVVKHRAKYVDDICPLIIDPQECFPEGVDAKLRAELTGNYLDGISAYESSIESDEPNEYEINSFIDDNSVNEAEDGQEESAQDEREQENSGPDYRELYEKLLVQHSSLSDAWDGLYMDYKELRHDVLGSAYDTSDLDDDFDDLHDYDSEEGYATVDVETQDPPLSEVILSAHQLDSQTSVISGGRLADRMEAFNAVLNGDEEGWNVPLMSTGDNHTSVEIEL